MKTAMKKAQSPETGNTENAAELFREAQSLIAKAAKKGVIHKNTAARKTSRLSKRIAAA